MHKIENDHILIAVRDQGAELTSLFDKKNNIEHLWQADPKFWGWHAPTLFPVVGRCLNDQIEIAGQKYPMEKHGFARHMDFRLVDQHADMLHFVLSASDKTLAIYPYLFDFHIFYEIKQNYLIQTFEIENTGNETMYFQLGGHPAFAVPFLLGEVYEDYFIEFEKDTVLDRENINTDGYFDTSISHVINGSNKLPLESDMFYRDAIILKEMNSRKVTIKSTKNPRQLSVEFPSFNYLGLWAKVNAPYVCIEPWLGCADTVGRPVPFKDKEGILSLTPEDKFQASIIITIS
jgi:galactose mutarotase-like enzyme